MDESGQIVETKYLVCTCMFDSITNMETYDAKLF